jgi:hypothetical protein
VETTASGAGSVSVAMCELAAEMADARRREGSLGRRWAQIGVELRLARMQGRGRCEITADESPVVYVNDTDRLQTQEFTVAHEVAHLLLGSLPPERLRDLSYDQEEKLCDDFARRVLVPTDEFAAELAGDERPSPRRVLELCGTFGASTSTILRALGHQLDLEDTAYVLARFRTHYRRPAVVGFRLDAVSGPARLFWPYETRIENVGLENLATAGAGAGHGEFFDGIEAELSVPLARVDRRTGHNTMVGPAGWLAVRQGLGSEPYVLARVDCSLLRGARIAKGRPAASAEEELPAEEVVA